MPVSLKYMKSLPLLYNGDCSLLGITPGLDDSDLMLYAEEIYGEEGWLARHALRLDGTLIASADEQGGENAEVKPLEMPADMISPLTAWHTMTLNFTGARHRGLRGPERVDEMLRPLSMAEKIALTEHLNLDILPPMLLGMAESYVLAEAVITRPNLFLLCRRIRLAILLEEEHFDKDNNPYNYDTLVLYAAHLYDSDADHETPLDELLTALPGVQLERPMDCLIYGDLAFVADGGSLKGDGRRSAIHIWQIRRSMTETQERSGLYE
ncbi:MAG: hypothetical protein H7175_01310 [Burkholderiales bacterium]|nr:hypothetical protein [Anaerolineae bacterium]